MSKLNKLAGGYKGGDNVHNPKPITSFTEEEKVMIDIEKFLNVVKERYIENIYSREDLECYIRCIEDLRASIIPTDLPKSEMLKPLIPFTRYMIDNSKINKGHLTIQIDYIQGLIDNIQPKVIDPKQPPKTEGKLNTLSRGYKK